MVVSVFSSSGQLSLGYHAIFSIVSVFFVLLIFGRAKQQAVLRYYALSSLAIAGIAYGLAMLSPENRTHLLIFAVATILIKTIAVPLVITYVQREYKYLVSPSSFLRPASSYFLAMAILIATFFAVNNNPAFEKIGYESLLYASVAMILLGLATMVIHRNIFSQIIGLLVIENGIAIFTLVTVESLPLPVESGVFLVTALTAIILASLSSRIRELIGSADTEELRNITE
jgi:hydrogenase-4 component E